MSLVIFLFVTTLFLFFLGSYALSPEHNPKCKKVIEDAKAAREGKRVEPNEYPLSEENIKILAAVFNGIALLLTTGLVCWVPFFRIIAAVAMVVMVVRFFYRRHRSKSDPNFAWCDQDPRPKAAPKTDEPNDMLHNS